MAPFDTSPLRQFSKFNNFFWVCCFLGKNLSDFIPPIKKTPQPVLPYSRTSSEETTTTPQDFLKFIYGQYSEEEQQQQNQNSNEVTTELNLDFLSMEQSESEESSSSTVRSLLFSSEITTTNWPNFLPKSSDNDDQNFEIQEGLDDESEDLLTFQSGFMPTPFQRTKSKNKTSDEGKN